MHTKNPRFQWVSMLLALFFVHVAFGQCNSTTQTNGTFAICQIFATVTDQPRWMNTTVPDICDTWNSTYLTCTNSDIVEIDLSHSSLELTGSLNLDNGNNKWPVTMTHIDLDHNEIAGSFPLSSFNQTSGMYKISIKNNQFSGQLDWDSLQYTSLRYFYAKNNYFSGIVYLSLLYYIL